MKKLYFLLLVFSFSVCLNAQTNPFGRNTDARTNQQGSQLKILRSYPNPASTFITFEFQRSYNSGYSIEVYNLPGKRVALASNIANKTTLQLQNFYRGVYMYKLVERTGKVVESGKFQVVK